MELKWKTVFHKPRHKFKFKTRTCLPVAIAKDVFRSRAGVAYFVKVGPRDENATPSAEGGLCYQMTFSFATHATVPVSLT
jgi:hypothetical protein